MTGFALDPSDNSDQYIRILDGLARYYNSEHVGHIGYMLTLFAIAITVLFQLYSLGRTSLEDMLRTGLIIVGSSVPAPELIKLLAVAPFVCLFIVFFFGPYPFCFRYQYARTQYYIVLTEVIWNHIGATQAKNTDIDQGVEADHQDVFKVYKRRADRMGIIEAILKLFEARLYLSICRRQKKNSQQEEQIQAQNLALFDAQEVCPIKGSDGTYYAYYSLSKVLYWNKTNLLRLAHRNTLKGYLRGSKDGDPHKIAELLLDKSSKSGSKELDERRK